MQKLLTAGIAACAVVAIDMGYDHLRPARSLAKQLGVPAAEGLLPGRDGRRIARPFGHQAYGTHGDHQCAPST